MKKTGKETTQNLPEWERLLSAQLVFQARFPEVVLVGGTAAALHVGHRISVDADHVLADLKNRFAEILRKLEREAGWRTKRLEPPVMILGHFKGVRTGVRQLVRSAPLETTTVRGLRVPTVEEMIRIKAYLILRRNTTRDFVDFVALFDHIGVKQAQNALASLDRLYPQKEGNSVTQQLAIQLSEPKPWDLSQTDLRAYKGLKEPYTDWQEVKRRAFVAGQKIILKGLSGLTFK
ncbi:MAG TPA: nucleotidyl transferase AbiEii/AbiGii toxin family protein [Bdellovibrionota bacterium]|nr:nucleotidyl transferase AbiEii/AbiGii toxin family protein [Bdellovibrionota bacterium]